MTNLCRTSLPLRSNSRHRQRLRRCSPFRVMSASVEDSVCTRCSLLVRFLFFLFFFRYLRGSLNFSDIFQNLVTRRVSWNFSSVDEIWNYSACQAWCLVNLKSTRADMYLGIKFFVDFSNLSASPLDANLMKNNQTETKVVQRAERVTNEIYLLFTRTIMPHQPWIDRIYTVITIVDIRQLTWKW